MSLPGRGSHESDRKKTLNSGSKSRSIAVTPQEKARIFATVSEIFGDKFEADVIKLIIEECDWEENETIEKLVQLSNDESSSKTKSECLGLDIIACKFLESAEAPAPQEEMTDSGTEVTDSSISQTYPEESGRMDFSTVSTSGLTYNYEELSQAITVPLPGGLFDMDASLSSQTSYSQPSLSGQWDSLEGEIGKEGQNVSSQSGFSGLTSKVNTATDNKPSAVPVQQTSSLAGTNHVTRPGLECVSSSSVGNYLLGLGEKVLDVSMPGSNVTMTPVEAVGSTNSLCTEGFQTKLIESTVQSGKTSTSNSQFSDMRLSVKAAEFVPSFLQTQPSVNTAPSIMPEVHLPNYAGQNRPLKPMSVRRTGYEDGQVSPAFMPVSPAAHIFGKSPKYEVPIMPIKSFQPVANSVNRFVGLNLNQPPASYSTAAAAASQGSSTTVSWSSVATPSTTQSPVLLANPVAAMSHSGSSSGVASGSKSSLMERLKQHGHDKLLIIMRGLPGSGKSFLARKIKGSGRVFSTDEYFTRGGLYTFRPEMLSDAHEWNQKRVQNAFDEGVTPVIVDNTNTEIWEMLPYAEMALTRGYTIEIVEPNNPWSNQPKRLAKMNIHGVSVETIKKMKERYQSTDPAALMHLAMKKLKKTLPKAAGAAQGGLPASRVEQEKRAGEKDVDRLPNQPAAGKPKPSGRKHHKKTNKEIISIRDHCLKLQNDGASEEEIDAWIFMANLKSNETCEIKDYLNKFKNNNNEGDRKKLKTSENSVLDRDSRGAASQKYVFDLKSTDTSASGSVLEANWNRDQGGAQSSKAEQHSVETTSHSKPINASTNSQSWAAPQPQRVEKRALLGSDSQQKSVQRTHDVREEDAGTAQPTSWDSSLPQRGPSQKVPRSLRGREPEERVVQGIWVSPSKVSVLSSRESTGETKVFSSWKSADLSATWQSDSLPKRSSNGELPPKADKLGKTALLNEDTTDCGGALLNEDTTDCGGALLNEDTTDCGGALLNEDTTDCGGALLNEDTTDCGGERKGEAGAAREGILMTETSSESNLTVHLSSGADEREGIKEIQREVSLVPELEKNPGMKGSSMNDKSNTGEALDLAAVSEHVEIGEVKLTNLSEDPGLTADGSGNSKFKADMKKTEGGEAEEHELIDLNSRRNFESDFDGAEAGEMDDNSLTDASRGSSVVPNSESTDRRDSTSVSKTDGEHRDSTDNETDVLEEAEERLEDLWKDDHVTPSSLVSPPGAQFKANQDLDASKFSEAESGSGHAMSTNINESGVLNALVQSEEKDQVTLVPEIKTDCEQASHAELKEEAGSTSKTDERKDDRISEHDREISETVQCTEPKGESVSLKTELSPSEKQSDNTEEAVLVKHQLPKHEVPAASMPSGNHEKTGQSTFVKYEKVQGSDSLYTFPGDQQTVAEGRVKDTREIAASECCDVDLNKSVVLVDYSSSEDENSVEEEISEDLGICRTSSVNVVVASTAVLNTAEESKADSRVRADNDEQSVSEPTPGLLSKSDVGRSSSSGPHTGKSDSESRPLLSSSTDHSRSGSPVIPTQDKQGMSSQPSDSSSPASPRKVRRKKHKQRPAPFFGDEVKVQLNSDSWKNFEPEKQIAGMDKTAQEGQDSKFGVKEREFSNSYQGEESYSHASTQTEGKDFALLLKGSTNLEENYVTIVANSDYKCSDNTDIFTRHSHKTMYDKSTMVDISEEPCADQMYSVFPEVAKAHLNEVLEVCRGDVTMAIDLMFEWGATNPITPRDKRHLLKQTLSQVMSGTVDISVQKEGNSPSRLMDLSMNALFQAGMSIHTIQQKVISSSQQRLHRIQSSEYQRLRSLSSLDSKASPVGATLQPDFSLTSFTASGLHSSQDGDLSDSSTDPSEIGSVSELQSVLAEDSKELLDLNKSLFETPHVSSLQSRSKVSVAEPGAGETVKAGEPRQQFIPEGDLTLPLPAGLVRNLEQLFGCLPIAERDTASSLTVQLDHTTAYNLYQCLSQSLCVQQTVREEDRLRQLREDEALAQWLQGEEEVDRTLESIGSFPPTSPVPRKHRALRPGEIAVDFQRTSVLPRPRPKPVNLMDIMEEEMERQHRHEKQAKVLQARGDHIAIATKLKRKKLQQIFPGVDENVLEDMFEANEYCLETTVSAISTALGGRQPVSHKLEMRADSKAEEEDHYTMEAAKQLSLQDVKMRQPEGSDQFQRVDAFSQPDQNYQELRQEALLHHYMRKECFQKAHDAHRRGMRDVADFYSKEGRAHFEKMKEANVRASERLLETRHEKIQQEMTLDLHGFHVEEAIAVLKRVIEEKEKEFQQKPVRNRHYLYVVTGRGKHSHQGVSRLRPVIIAHLEATNYKYTDTKPGLLKVFLHPPS